MPKKLKIPLDDRPSEIKTAEKKKGSIFQESTKKSLESLKSPERISKRIPKAYQRFFLSLLFYFFFQRAPPRIGFVGRANLQGEEVAAMATRPSDLTKLVSTEERVGACGAHDAGGWVIADWAQISARSACSHCESIVSARSGSRIKWST